MPKKSGGQTDKYLVFEYMYRDAGNWKTYGSLLLKKNLTGDFGSLAHHFDSGCYFVAEQIGIPSLLPEHVATYGGPDDLDHGFHEFVELRPARKEDIKATAVAGTVSKLLGSLLAVGNRWDLSLSAGSEH